MNAWRLHKMLCSLPLMAAVSGANAGGMLLSDRDRSLAINAWGGAQENTVLRLHNGCRPDNPDCTWTYRNGMLISDRNPALAIGTKGRPDHGAEVVLVAGCRPERSECRWSYRSGMFVNDASGIPINAWDGARFGTVLKLHRDCRPNNPDCTWSR